MNEIITVESTEMQIREYNGQRVVTFKDIDTVHKNKSGVARRNFNRNKKHFVEGEDYFSLTREISNETNCPNRNITIPNKGITVLTESGYLMIAKSFNDDLAWKVQRRLVNSYFHGKEDKNPLAQIPDIHSYAKPVFHTSSTKVPRNASWYERNRRRMNYLAQRSQRQTKDVYHHILKRLGEEFDLDAAKEIYTREKGYPPKYAMDVVSYFPELAELAEIHLGIMEKTTEKAIRDAKKARESREEMENQ